MTALLGTDSRHQASPAVEADPAVQTLLRCWARETDWLQVTRAEDVPEAGAVVALHLEGAVLRVPLLYRSPCGWHRFGAVRTLAGAVVDAGLLAALLTRTAAERLEVPAAAALTALTRLLDSASRITGHVLARAAEDPGDEAALPPFLAAEQALVVGHPFHPAGKARGEAAESELAAWSPERRGRFALHWFAAAPSRVLSDSAMPTSAVDVLRGLAVDAGLDVPAGLVPVPVHPWQARQLPARPAVADLLARGDLVALGPAGAPWYPTSSLRTVWSPDAPVMLKLSLGMRITNSRRENLRSELALGVVVSRLLAAGLQQELSAFPSFGIVRDPGWIAVDSPAAPGTELGFETALRDNPFDRRTPVACVAGLLDERPDRRGRAEPGSDLARILRRTGMPGTAAAEQWFERYLDVLVEPLLHLYLGAGLALEAHHQNALLTLDRDGWPVGGWYRDSQGYWIAASAADTLLGTLPEPPPDREHLVFADDLVQERLTYYLLVNNILGVVGALGSAGLADEDRLLAAFRRRIAALGAARARDGSRGPRDDLLDRWLDDPTLRSKANLLTTVDGRDELVGHPASQSVYVDLPNPLHRPDPPHRSSP